MGQLRFSERIEQRLVLAAILACMVGINWWEKW